MNKPQLTPEQLLLPRYMVIAPWPGMPPQLMNKVITLDKFGAGKYWHEWTVDEPVHIEEGCTKYSANLRLMHWSEGRTVEQMPGYLSFTWDGDLQDVVKVTNWLYQKEGDNSTPITGFRHESHNDKGVFPRVSLNGWEPATEEQYITYINSKK